MNSNTRIILGILIAVLSSGVLLPTGIALARNHPKVVSVTLWNTLGLLLFGLGWLVALVISLTGDSSASGTGQPTTVIVNNYVGAAPVVEPATKPE